MYARQAEPQGPGRQQSGDNQRRRRLMFSMPEVTPLLETSSSFSSTSSFSSIFSDKRDEPSSPHRLTLVQQKRGWMPTKTKTFSLMTAAASILRSLFPSIQALLTPTCQWLSVPPVMIPTFTSSGRRKVTGTFFGQKRGRVCFAVQEDPKSEPVLLVDLAIPTCHLVKEMASGMLRILLECERSTVATGGSKKKKHIPQRSLWEEPLWTMYCNGNKRGYAVSRPCMESDFHVLSAVQTVSVGAGVLPVPNLAPALPPPHSLERNESFKNDGCLYDGGGGAGSEVMYMRAKFERVVGGRDSEAFYMINPDCGRGSNYTNGGPELSIFLLRV